MIFICCQKCDIDTTIELDISNKKLLQISKKVFQLINLQKFDCSSNNIKIIPKEIGNLIDLQKFHCNSNKIK
jgi:Leucine-rich repeat (LRR) protein